MDEGGTGKTDDELNFGERINVEDAPNVSSESEGNEDQLSLDAGFIDNGPPTEEEQALFKGRTFKDWDAFKVTIQEYEAKTGWTFKRLKRDKAWARMRCRGWVKGNPNSCQVELSVRCLKRTGLITIRKVSLNHTCSSAIHKFRNGSHNAAWVARKIIKQVRINPLTPLSELNDYLRTFQNANSKMWSIQKARVSCQEEISGGTKLSFQRIPAYVAAIRAIDGNAHAFYQTGEERRFARLYVAPSSSQHVYQFCRPLVGLDGTHTSGKYPMIILFATCFDGENHIVVLAWAVVKVENFDNWLWFTENLRLSYPTMKQPNVVFISDRDKGLRAAIAESFPDGNHGHCVQHIRANIKGNIDLFCSKFFKKLADAKTEGEFEDLLVRFEPATERQAKFVEYVRKICPTVYARHAFPVPRYGHNTSNIVEIINGAVKPCRVLPALRISDYLWVYVMEKHCERAEHARQLPRGQYALTQHANTMYKSLYREARTAKERQSSPTQSLVVDSKGSWAVNLVDRTCDCKDWYEHDFPCSHAMCVMLERGLDFREFVGKIWLAENQVQAYEIPVPPLSIDHLAISNDNCFEPSITVKRGRKKGLQRVPGRGEQMSKNHERLVRKQSHKCRKCKQPGHNSRKCPSLPPAAAMAPAETVPAGTRSRNHVAAFNAQAQTEHETLVVNEVHTATRRTTEEDWSFFQTRTSTLSFTEHVEMQDVLNTQAGAPQPTPDG